jgi:hypothetical protein
MPTAALPWLMRMGPFLKSFRHPFRKKVPGTEGVLGPGTRPGYTGRPTRPGPGAGAASPMRTGYRGDIGTRPAGPLNIQEHPVRASLAAGTGAFAAYPFLRGEQEPPITPSMLTTPVRATGAAPYEDMMSFAESEIAMAEEGEENFRKLLEYGGLIKAIGGDASGFFEKGKMLLEKSEKYAKDKQYAKAVRAVYKKGDMPKSARDAYERLTPLVGPERAATLSGHQLGMEPGKTKEERAYRRIEEMALQGDLEGAAAQLVAAWNSGLLKNPATHITQWEAQMDRARQVLEGIVSGGGGAAGYDTPTNIRLASA